VKKVTERLAPEKVSLGVSSLRAYGLGEDVLDDLQRVRATGVTFAPEAGSQRMRDVVNKNVTEEQLLETAERVFSRGWSSMKLYFMIGLPTEEETDVREIVQVGRRAREVGRRVKKAREGGGPPKVTVSVSTHVPKPHTPFQWCAMDPASVVREKQKWLDEEARASGGVDLRMHDCDTSWLEGVFARGDRSLCDVLERAYRSGARFDSWEDQLRIDVWEAAFEACGVDVAKYLGTIPVTARLPWDHISVGLEEGFLAREYRKALKSRLSPPCGKAAGMFVHHTNLGDAEADAQKLVCYDCGVACDLSAMRGERLVYLSKLGARSRVEPKPLPPPPPKDKKKGPPPRIEQGAPRRYRFVYTKLGPSAFLSHLDLIRAIPRAFRRIDLPLYYSSGYHPKPEMTFGPALSLGVSSSCEVVDVKLTADVDPSRYLDDLTAGSAVGIRFLAAVRLGEQDASVSRVVDRARYVVGVPRSVLAQLGGDAWLDERIASVLGAEKLEIVRRIDGIGKKVDVRAFLRGIAPCDGAALAKAGLVGDLASFVVDVAITGSGAVKIGEVVEVLSPDLPFRAVRTALGAWNEARGDIASPVDLADLAAVKRQGERRSSVPVELAT
jgi:radical SAM-linked protein